MRSSSLAFVALALGGTACAIGRPVAPVVLYGSGHDRRPAGDVATLYGPVGTVDGRDVSGRGHGFELLPGCHVVTLRKQLGGSDASAVASSSATLPPVVFAFRMQAGHRYTIEVRTLDSGSAGGQFLVSATDRDAAGASTPVAPASAADVESCRASDG